MIQRIRLRDYPITFSCSSPFRLYAKSEMKSFSQIENITTKSTKDTKYNLIIIPRLATGTLPMGFPKGRSGSSPLWSNTRIQTPFSI